MSALMASGNELVPLSLMSRSPIRMPSHMVTALLRSSWNALLVKSETSMRRYTLNGEKTFCPSATPWMECPVRLPDPLNDNLSVKWDQQYSEMVNFIRTLMSLSVVRANTLLVCSERAHSWKRGAPEDGSAATATPTFRSE